MKSCGVYMKREGTKGSCRENVLEKAQKKHFAIFRQMSGICQATIGRLSGCVNERLIVSANKKTAKPLY